MRSAHRATLVLLCWTSATIGRPLMALEPPRLVDVFTSGKDGYHTYRIPSIIKAANGDLLAFCEGRKASRDDTGDIDLVSRRSSDGGQTWAPTKIVWDDGPHTCGNPCPVIDASTGKIWLVMTHNLGVDREPQIIDQTSQGTRTVWVTSSEDHGLTWTKPVEITATTKRPGWTWYATGPGAGIQLTKGETAGRLVIPCDHITVDKRLYSHVIYSDDHGRSWRIGGVAPKEHVNECEVVELADARLMLNMRNGARASPARQIAFSHDGGETWTNQRHDPMLIEPRCQGSIRRIRWPQENALGLIAFSNPASESKRERMTLRLSDDDGGSWPRALQLYSGSSAYSCLVALSENEIGCLFEVDNYGRIVFTRIATDAVPSR